MVMPMRTRKSAAQWGELVSAWGASGLAADVFASEHGVAASSLRWWKTELARRARNEPARRLPRPHRKDCGVVALARVVREGDPTPITDEPANPPVVVVVGAARILVQHDFDGQLLRAVVDALGNQP